MDVFLYQGAFTASWTNYAVRSGNNYTWYPAGYVDEWDGTHNVFAGHGEIGAVTSGSSATELAGQNYECTYTRAGVDFYN